MASGSLLSSGGGVGRGGDPIVIEIRELELTEISWLWSFSFLLNESNNCQIKFNNTFFSPSSSSVYMKVMENLGRDHRHLGSS